MQSTINQNKHYKYTEEVWIIPTLDGKLPAERVIANKREIGRWIVDNYKQVKANKNIPIKQAGERFWHFNYTQAQLRNWQNSIRLRFPEVTKTEFMPPNSYLEGEGLNQKIEQLKEIAGVIGEDSQLEAIIFLLEEIARYRLKANLLCLRTAALPQIVELKFKVAPAVTLPVELQNSLMQAEDRQSERKPEELFADSLNRELESAISLAIENNSNCLLNTVKLLSWQTK